MTNCFRVQLCRKKKKIEIVKIEMNIIHLIFFSGLSENHNCETKLNRNHSLIEYIC